MRTLIITILLVNLTLLTGCKEETSRNEIVEVVKEYALIHKVLNEVSNTNDDTLEEAETNPTGTRNSFNEPTITVSPADLITFPKTITIDFGNGYIGLDDVVRKGKLIIVSTNWRREIGSVHTMTFDNYFQNDHQVEGTHISTNISTEPGDSIFSIEMQNGKITTPTNAIINFTQETTRTRIAGGDTPLNIWDNEYYIDGNYNGISSTNITFDMDIIETLHFKVVPRGIYGGISNLTIGSQENILVNFNNRTITLNGNMYDF